MQKPTRTFKALMLSVVAMAALALAMGAYPTKASADDDDDRSRAKEDFMDMMYLAIDIKEAFFPEEEEDVYIDQRTYVYVDPVDNGSQASPQYAPGPPPQRPPAHRPKIGDHFKGPDRKPDRDHKPGQQAMQHRDPGPKPDMKKPSNHRDPSPSVQHKPPHKDPGPSGKGPKQEPKKPVKQPKDDDEKRPERPGRGR
ncbi:MAG: hypothetical protein LBF40_06235 [Deltaproteobacteria bacterium]|jgi:hypothetical protein|nr:hypothetical protein [Deltaproteobacteria bacterium]